MGREEVQVSAGGAAWKERRNTPTETETSKEGACTKGLACQCGEKGAGTEQSGQRIKS